MAIPKIKNLIEARVKDTGDTITGNLVIEKSTYPSIALGNTATGTRTNLQTWDNSSVLQCLLEAGNTDNRRGLFLKNSRAVAAASNALTLRDWIDGTYTEYKIYGEHNKDLIKEVCLPIEGGTIDASSGDTPLYIKSGSASTWIGYKDSTNTPLGFLGMKSDGPAYYKDQTYLLLHAGNYSNYELNANKITSGTLAVARGGTGQTTARNAANAFMNALETGSSTPTDADYYISQYVSGGTTNTTYHRRPMSALWSYVNGKVSANYLKLSGGTLTGNLTIDAINNVDRFITFNSGDNAGYSWRMGYLGTGSDEKNYFVIQSNSTNNTWANVIRCGLISFETQFNGNLSILTGDTDRYITWDYSDSTTAAGASWRIGMQGTGSGDANYFVIQTTGSNTGNSETFANAVRIGMNSKDVLLGNNLNLPGSYQQNGITGRLASITSSAPSLTTANKILWAW